MNNLSLPTLLQIYFEKEKNPEQQCTIQQNLSL